jgi:hypothetical protein
MNRDLFNRDKSSYQYRFNMVSGVERAWCHNDAGDYCPLVIASMSIVILLSLALILFLCTRKSFGCKYCRNVSLFLRRKLLKAPSRIENSMLPRNHHIRRPIYQHNSTAILSSTETTRPSNLEILQALETPVSISRTSTLTSRLLNRLNNFGSFLSTNSSRSARDSNRTDVWFVDMTKHASPPPPTYDESQHIERVNFETDSQLRQSMRTAPIATSSVKFNQASSFNDAFSLENLNETQPESRIIFPSYRCMTLTTDLTTAQPTLCLIEHPQVETLTRNLDEVPPPYEAVVNPFVPPFRKTSSQLSRTRSLFNAGFNAINAKKFYRTLNKSNIRREFVF